MDEQPFTADHPKVPQRPRAARNPPNWTGDPRKGGHVGGPVILMEVLTSQTLCLQGDLRCHMGLCFLYVPRPSRHCPNPARLPVSFGVPFGLPFGLPFRVPLRVLAGAMLCETCHRVRKTPPTSGGSLLVSRVDRLCCEASSWLGDCRDSRARPRGPGPLPPHTKCWL